MTLTQSRNVMDADLVIDGDGDDWGIAVASDHICLLRWWQELKAGNECSMRFLHPFQTLRPEHFNVKVKDGFGDWDYSVCITCRLNAVCISTVPSNIDPMATKFPLSLTAMALRLPSLAIACSKVNVLVFHLWRKDGGFEAPMGLLIVNTFCRFGSPSTLANLQFQARTCKTLSRGGWEYVEIIQCIYDSNPPDSLEEVFYPLRSIPAHLGVFPALGHVPHEGAPILADGDDARPVGTEVEIVDLLFVRLNLVRARHLGECPEAEETVDAASR